MRPKLTVKLYPWEAGNCDFEVYVGGTFVASGKAASLKQAESRCNYAFGPLIGEFEVVAGADLYAKPIQPGEQVAPLYGDGIPATPEAEESPEEDEPKPKRGRKFRSAAEDAAAD